MSEYVKVMHGELGPFQHGAVLRTDRFDPDDLARLEAAGAVTHVDATEEYSGADALTLAETLRYPSQYTLPNVPHTDVDADTLRGRLGLPPEAASVTTAQTQNLNTQAAAKARGQQVPPETRAKEEKPKR